jgi:hypothetical protein
MVADDDLNKFVEQNRILAQKVKAEATQAMAQSRVLEKSDPAEAQSILQKALRQVQNSTALPAGDQTQLTAQLLGRLREVNEAVRLHKVDQAQAPLKELPRKPVDATGTGAAGVAQKVIDNRNAAVDAGDRLREEKNKGFGAAVGGIASSAVIPQGDVTFPKDWADKTKSREKYIRPQLTEKEVALLKALNSVLSVDFDNKPLKDVIEYLQERTGQSIIVDPESLKESNTDYTDPVTFKVKKATFRTILRKVLADSGLTYVIKEGTIQAMTPARAREMMVVRSYPISDLVAASGMANRFGPFVARAQMLSNVQTLIQMIKTSVDPTLWQENGGNGNISFYEPGMALLIRAPTEFHYQLAGTFGGSR